MNLVDNYICDVGYERLKQSNLSKYVIHLSVMIHPSELLMMTDRTFYLVVLKDPNGSLRFHFKSLRLGTWQVKSIEFSGYKWLPWLLESKNMTGFWLKIEVFCLKIRRSNF